MPDPENPTADLEASPMYVLEPAVLLSQSMLWRLQRTFYGDQGIAAWTQSKVPQSVTTSPNIAGAYARLVHAYLRDLANSIDPAEPVYIVELGAGSGRFAYRFLISLLPLLAGTRVMYVMTDASDSVIEFWRDNQRLRRFVDAGVLDFARFDLLDLQPLTLQHAGVTLRPGEVVNPVVMLGNYIFDTIPQDAFTATNGQLFANLVTVSASVPELDLTAPDARVRISISFAADANPTNVSAEPDPLVRSILGNYQKHLDNTTLLLPRAAMACVRFFRALGRQRALCLIGDFGDTREDELRGHGPPGFGAGGAFWLPVNFHALGELARGLGGHVRHPNSRHLTLTVDMLLFGEDAATAFPATELAYSNAIDVHGPDEISMVCRYLAEQLPSLKLEATLALLRATGWDTEYVVRCMPALLEGLPTADDRLRQEALGGVQLAWQNYFPIGEPDDLPFCLGVILFSVAQYTEALEFFERSLRDFGDHPRTTLNLALTMYRLGRLPESIQWLDRTLALDPTDEMANAMRPDVLAEIRGE